VPGGTLRGARKANHLGFHGAGAITSMITFPLLGDRSACVRVRVCVCVCQGGGRQELVCRTKDLHCRECVF